MKVTKEGRVKLERGEFRVGNFFVKDEADTEHFKVSDLNSCFTLRVWKRLPLGIWMQNMVERGEAGRESLKAWIALMWSILSVAPDEEFARDLLSATKANLARHEDLYRFKGGDDEALKEVEEMTEFEAEMTELSKKKEELEDGGQE